MAPRPSARELIEALDTANSYAGRIAALRQAKYELTGHLSRKADYVRSGLLISLSRILNETYDEIWTENPRKGLADPDKELTCALAAQILCVIAHEGPEFVRPILSTEALEAGVALLLCTITTKTTLAVLRCLNAVADNLPPAAQCQWTRDESLAALIYCKKYIHIFKAIIEQANGTLGSQQACDSVLALMCKTLTHETQKRALVESGLLSTLCERLAGFVVAEGLVPPIADDQPVDIQSTLPRPVPSNAHLSPALEAISVLTAGSTSRTKAFLTNPVIKTVFPDARDDFSPSDIRKAPWGASYLSGTAVPRSRSQGPFDSLLPVANTSHRESTQSAFPSLSSAAAVPKRRTSFVPQATETPQFATVKEPGEDLEDSPVISWLLYVARESLGKRRVLAAGLLVNMYSLNFIRKVRACSFASLLIPLLVKMLAAVEVERAAQPPTSSLLSNGSPYSHAVPAVLAALVIDDREMQEVAVDCKAIVYVSAALRSTFDTFIGREKLPWQPRDDAFPAHQDIPQARLGRGGPSSARRRDMAYREGCLRALAALAPFEDDYRGAICDQGVLTYVVSALEPFRDTAGADECQSISGNSPSVIIAACALTGMLARSEKALRTKLVEAEVSRPVIALLNSTNPEVRIAATKALANLALDFSPSKESVGEPSVVKKLCEQAHSASARLRHESLWALKQLVLNADKKLKQSVVDELGSSWIKLLIKTDPIDIPEGEIIGLVERDYPPLGSARRMVGYDASQDVVMGEDSDGEPTREADESLAYTSGFDTKHTTQEDTDIQGQLLDLLRNLFCGEGASELVKYVFDEMGEDDFFKIMLERLRPRTLAGPTRKENYTTPAPSVIVLKTLYVLVHLAACEPKWRQAIATDHALLKQVMGFCTHKDREIRALCCWIVINLTYEDDTNDRLGCRSRAIELHKIGFGHHLRNLESDSDLDVRERAKSALHLMQGLVSP